MLTALVAAPRLGRLVDGKRSTARPGIDRNEFLADLARRLARLDADMKYIDPYRRNLQRAYLDLMGDKVNGRQAADEGGRCRGANCGLAQSVRIAIAKAADRETRLHLEDVRDQIAKILVPKFAPPLASAAPLHASGFDVLEHVDPTVCWSDYIIRGEGPAFEPGGQNYLR